MKQTQEKTYEQAQAFIDELHRDVYNAFSREKMTVDDIAKTLNLSPENIRQMIQTYEGRIERGTIA